LSVSDFANLLKASYNKSPPELINGFILDKSVSSDTAKTYYNPETNQAVIAHRGTQGLSDWVNNAVYAVGGLPLYKYTSRYNEGKKIQDKAIAKYGLSNITTIGSSQGAILARDLGKNTHEVLTFNPAYRGERRGDNEYSVKSTGDIVSSWQLPTMNDILIPARSKQAIVEHDIDILNRIEQKKYIGH